MSRSTLRNWFSSKARKGHLPMRRTGRPRPLVRPLRFEPLEDRRLLAVDFTAGVLMAPAANRADIIPGTPDPNPGIIRNVTEPLVMINPTDPGNLVISSQQFLRVTNNAGGNTAGSFTPNFTFPNAAGAANNGDTATAFDAAGRLFWSNLNDPDGMTTPRRDIAVAQLQYNAGTNTVGVATDTAGVPIPTALVPNPNNRSGDKQFLAADANPASPFANNLYLSYEYYNAATDEFETFVSRSTNQGVIWSNPLQLSVNAGATTEGFTWPSTVAVGPGGEVYVAYHSQPDLNDTNVEGNAPLLLPGTTTPNPNRPLNPNGTAGQVILFTSTDGGVSFPQRSVPFGPGQADITFNRQDAANGGNIPGTTFWTMGSAQPWVLVDPTDARNVYVITADDPDNVHGTGDDADVVIARSTDSGQTWTRTTVSAGPAGLNSFELFPTAAIDGDGNIVVAWYDNRRQQRNNVGPDGIANSPDDDWLLDVWTTYSTDDGVTWAPEFMVNDPGNPFDPDAQTVQRFPGVNNGNPFTWANGRAPGNTNPIETSRMGEYIGVANFGGTGYVIWNSNNPGGTAAAGTGQQVRFDAFPINGAITVRPDRAVSDDITLRRIGGNTDFMEVRVGGDGQPQPPGNGPRQYAGLVAALAPGGIQINGLREKDRVFLDRSNGNPIPPGTTLTMDLRQVTVIGGVSGATDPGLPTPGSVSFDGRLYRAGTDDDEDFWIEVSDNGGASFHDRIDFANPGTDSGHEQARGAPSLAVWGGELYIVWTGTDDVGEFPIDPDGRFGFINVAVVQTVAATGVPTGLKPNRKQVLGYTSRHEPTVESHAGGLFITWIGLDDNLYLDFTSHFKASANPNIHPERNFGPGAFHPAVPETDDETTPRLTSSGGSLFLRWVDDDDNAHLETVTLLSTTSAALTAPPDNTAPQSTPIAIGVPRFPAGATQPFVTSHTAFSSTATDDLSGVDSVSYRFFLQGATPPEFTRVPGTTAVFTLTGPDGLYQVETRATDLAGNVESTHTQLVYLDNTAPVATIIQPAATEYAHSAVLTLDYTVDDGSGSGVVLSSMTVTLDGATTLAGHGLASGQSINLLTELPIGSHTFSITANDNLGNSGTTSVIFEIIVTPESIKEDVRYFLSVGAIKNEGLANSLLAKLNAAARAIERDQCPTAINNYNAFIHELNAQSGQGIDATAAAIMMADAEYLIANCDRFVPGAAAEFLANSELESDLLSNELLALLASDVTYLRRQTG